jgi:DNA polymerase III subunit epsilon
MANGLPDGTKSPTLNPMSREIIFDTETTGFDPSTGDRLVEMGCIEMVGLVPTGAVFHAYYNPERGMPKAAEDIHGLSDAFLSNKPLFADTVDELLEFLGDAPLVAHNATFDFRFLNAELTRAGRPPVGNDRMIDTLAISRTQFPGAKHSLDALCTRFGIDRSHRTKHGALLDAELLAQLYIELRGGKQIGFSLAGSGASSGAGSRAGAANDDDSLAFQPRADRPFREPRPHAASVEERARHRDFIAKLSNPLWDQGHPKGPLMS